MNDDRPGRDDAERILRDAAGGPRPGQDPLTAFLAAAAAPPHDGEQAGEDAAVSAFRRERLRRGARSRPARALTIKTAVAVGASAALVGGVALAAGTGTLPGPLGDNRPASERTSVRPATSRAPAVVPPSGNGATAGEGTGTPVPTPSPTPQGKATGNDKSKNKNKGAGKQKKKKKPTPPGHTKAKHTKPPKTKP
ncbi:MAG TPA: hypothetical protein VH912_27840 [Streptosporangiaceae bacterium]